MNPAARTAALLSMLLLAASGALPLAPAAHAADGVAARPATSATSATGATNPTSPTNAGNPAGAASPPAPAAAAAPAASGSGRNALTVTLVSPQRSDWPQRLAAAGSVAAWQEVVIGAEGAGGRLVAVTAQVGDRVRRGELLARIATDTLQADQAQTRAAIAEAEANLAEAQAQAQRAGQLAASGFYSPQQATQAANAEAAARARLQALRERLRGDEARLAQARVLAPDDGVVAARAATAGAMAAPGQELFRLIRQGRLEWRAEVPAADLVRLKPGADATLTTPSGRSVRGRVRLIGPTVDPQTRNGLVYVDLGADAELKAGMFARGEFLFGQASALTLPQTAVQWRDGFATVARVDAQQRVQLLRVGTGRRQGERIEITSGLGADAQVVAAGGAFLADGDTVRVVPAAGSGGVAR